MADAQLETTVSHETVGSAGIKDLLRKITFEPGRAIDPSIKSIDLESIGIEADKLMKATLADPRKREHGQAFYILRDGRIITDEEPYVGGVREDGKGEEVLIPIKISKDRSKWFLPKRLRQDKVAVAVVHTHGGVDIPPSPQDLLTLFYPNDELAALTCMIIVTKELKIVIFRGRNTPTWTPEETKRKIDQWDSLHEKRVWQNLRFGMSAGEQMNHNARANIQLILDIARKYDLRVFTSPISRNTATIVSA